MGTPSVEEIRRLTVEAVDSENKKRVLNTATRKAQRVAARYKKKIDRFLLKAAGDGRDDMGVRIYVDGMTEGSWRAGYDRPHFPRCSWLVDGVDVKFFERYGDNTASIVVALAEMLTEEYEAKGYELSTNIKMDEKEGLRFIGISVDWGSMQLASKIRDIKACASEKEREALVAIA